MLPFQRKILASLRTSNKYVIFPADKNLGPCITERNTYIARALKDHLLDTETYQRFSKRNANYKIHHMATQLERFIEKYKEYLRKSDVTY